MKQGKILAMATEKIEKADIIAVEADPKSGLMLAKVQLSASERKKEWKKWFNQDPAPPIPSF